MLDDGRKTAAISPKSGHGRRGPAPLDRLIVAIGARQHGVIALWQLLDLGLSPRAASDRVAAGRLHRVHQGVYAVGRPDLPPKGRWAAAVLACGDGALLSHRSAAALHGLLRVGGSPIDVTVPRRSCLSRPGLRIHRSTCLAPEDGTTVDGIACTSVAATLLSLAAVVPPNILESACNQAELDGVFDLEAIEELLERRRRAAGTARLRSVLSLDALGDRSKSGLERRFLRLVRRAGLPEPAVNEWIAVPGEEMQCDFVWHARRVIVEVDSWKFHSTRRAFHDDRRRDRALRFAGWQPLRFTDRDLDESSSAVVTELRTALAATAA
jgi:very-short-patch-repair endonuclease